MHIAKVEWLNVAEAAGYLRMSPDSVRRWCREGHLKATKVGRQGRYRIQVDDLMEMVQKVS